MLSKLTNNKCTINRWQPPLINHNWVASRVLATRAALGTSIEARLRKIYTKMHGRQVLEFASFDIKNNTNSNGAFLISDDQTHMMETLIHRGRETCREDIMIKTG